MRMLIRIVLIATLVFTPASAVLVGAPSPAAEQPVVTCESDPAPDAGEVRIGTAILMGRGPAAASVAASCDGTLTNG